MTFVGTFLTNEPHRIKLINKLLRFLRKKQDGYKLNHLKPLPKIAGTSLILQDDKNDVYKHIGKTNTREFLFYYTILLSESIGILSEEIHRIDEECFGKVSNSIKVPNDINFKTHSIPLNSKFSRYSSKLIQDGFFGYTCNDTTDFLCLPQGEIISNFNLVPYNKKKELHKLRASRRQLESLYQLTVQELNKFYILIDFQNFIQCLNELQSLDIIPEFLGLLNATQSDPEFYIEIGPDILSPYENSINFLKMKNFFSSFQLPAVLDIKIGSEFIGRHVCEPGYNERIMFKNVPSITREALTEKWRSTKRSIRESKSFLEACNQIEEITSDILEFEDDRAKKLTPQQLHDLLKSWRQEKVIKDTTQHSLGFRISGCTFNNKFGKKVSIGTKEGAQLSRDQTLGYIAMFCSPIISGLKDIIEKISQLSTWLSSQNYFHFYATSLVISYDTYNTSKYIIKWVDFANAIPRNSHDKLSHLIDDSASEINQHIIFGLKNISNLLYSITKCTSN